VKEQLISTFGACMFALYDAHRLDTADFSTTTRSSPLGKLTVGRVGVSVQYPMLIVAMILAATRSAKQVC